MFVEGISQSVVSRYASGNSHMLDFRILYGLAEFCHKNVDDSTFERCRKVFLVMFDEIRVSFYPFAQAVQERGLQSAEAVVQPWYMRF